MKLHLTALALCALSTGCVSKHNSGVSRTIGDTAAALGGAAIGYVASDGDARVTVGGAVAGFGMKRYADHVKDQSERQKIQEAYDTAHAHATRALYDATQRLQSEPVAVTESAPPEDDGAVYLPTQLPERNINGVLLDTTVEYIRITDTSAPASQ